MSFRPLPLMSVLTIVSLAILIWLGNWQYGRYSEKLGKAPEEAAQFGPVLVDVDTANPGNAQQVYGIVDGEAVWRRYLPGRIDGQGELVLVLWDATSGTRPVPMAISDAGPVAYEANVFIREPGKQSFGGKNDPANDSWYHFDGRAMLSNLGYEMDTQPRVVEPDILTVRLADELSRSRQTENPYATPVVRDPLPPERHFGYALTWWGLAIALIGVYAAFHHSRGRLRFKKQD